MLPIPLMLHLAPEQGVKEGVVSHESRGHGFYIPCLYGSLFPLSPNRYLHHHLEQDQSSLLT
jgi:hypothetical protein